MDAQKFGHTVGQFFKKIDRTLSFLPGKPRKAVVTAAALAASPILAGVIISKTKPSKNSEYLDEEPVSDTSLLSELLANDDSSEEGKWDYGFQGFGYYINGVKVYGDDDD